MCKILPDLVLSTKPTAENNALDVVKKRYAKGEITKEDERDLIAAKQLYDGFVSSKTTSDFDHV